MNEVLGHPLGELLAARIPSIVLGTILVLAVYWLGRAPFGRRTALIAALALAVSPWLDYFSALAYLDMTMATFVTLAYLVLWHAFNRPWLFPVVALLMVLGIDSKYPAALVVPAIVLFTVYYYFMLRPLLPADQRPKLPWRWWIATILIAPLSFFLVDPAIWPNPIARLRSSFQFEAIHSSVGHPTFLAGNILLHVPQWTVIYMTFTKMSAFLTIPAAFFVVFALIKLLLIHLRKAPLDMHQATSYAYLVIWLLSVFSTFSLLNIAVGTHYYLPVAPSVALAGVSGMTIILQFIANRIWKRSERTENTEQVNTSSQLASQNRKRKYIPQLALTILLAFVTIGPHLLGVITIHAAEGYTTEFFNNDEDTRLQVAYPGYRDALEWLSSRTPIHTKIALIATAGTLPGYSPTTNWFSYNQDVVKYFQLFDVLPTEKSYQGYSYLIWPKHLVQRGYPLPPHDRIIHTISGGNTIYCYIVEVTG